MPRSPSFFNPTAANSPVMQAYAADPRQQLAQSLIAAGSNARPVNSPVEGLARLASALVGAYQSRQLGKEYQERQGRYGDTLKQAFNAAEPWRTPDDITNEAGTEVVVPRGQSAPGTGGLKALAAALAGNPDTAGMAAEMRMGDLERKQGIQDTQDAARFTQDLAIEGAPRMAAAQLPGQIAQARGVGGVNNELALALEGQMGPMKTAQAIAQESGLGPVKAANAGLVAGAEQPYRMAQIGAQAAATAANQPPRGPAGPFGGNVIEAQDSNILLKGDPSSPEYALAYSRQAAPKTTNIEGVIQTVTPDMRWARPPTGAQGGAQPAPGTVAPPALAGSPAPPPGAPVITQQRVTDHFNENQGKAAGFADRMAKSGPIVNQFEGSGTSRSNRMAGAVPVIGNSLVSKDYQNFEQAKQDWLIAQLRRESGAAIGDPEYLRTEKQYFPVPGDDASTIQQKRELRAVAHAAMQREAGSSYRGAAPPRQRARNPQTGEEVELDPQTNQWVPVR